MRGRQNLVGQATDSSVEEDEVHRTELVSAIEGLKDRFEMPKAGKPNLCLGNFTLVLFCDQTNGVEPHTLCRLTS